MQPDPPRSGPEWLCLSRGSQASAEQPLYPGREAPPSLSPSLPVFLEQPDPPACATLLLRAPSLHILPLVLVGHGLLQKQAHPLCLPSSWATVTSSGLDTGELRSGQAHLRKSPPVEDWNRGPQNIGPPGTGECDLIWQKGLCRCH